MAEISSKPECDLAENKNVAESPESVTETNNMAQAEKAEAKPDEPANIPEAPAQPESQDVQENKDPKEEV